jgi:predicted ATPase
MQLAKDTEDPTLVLHASYVLGDTHLWRGEFRQARMHLDQDAALADPRGRRSHALAYGLDPGTACLSHAAWALWLLGHPDQALVRARQATRIAGELSHPLSSAWAVFCVATLHRHRQEWQLAQKQAEALIALSTEQGFPHWVLLGTILRGWTLAKQGLGRDEIDRMHESLLAWRGMGAELDTPHGLALLAEAYAATRRPAEGLTAVTDALALVDRTGERMWEAELYRLRGGLHRTAGATDLAEADLDRSLAIARRQDIKMIELRASVCLARLWRDQRRDADASDLLRPIYGRFTEGFDTADLKEAKALLKDLTYGR